MSRTTPLFKAKTEPEPASPVRRLPGIKMPATKSTTPRASDGSKDSVASSKDSVASPLKRELASSAIAPTSHESPTAKQLMEQYERAKSEGRSVCQAAKTSTSTGRQTRDIEVQTDIQLRATVWALPHGNNHVTNADVRIHESDWSDAEIAGHWNI